MKYLITKNNIVKIFPDEVSHSKMSPKKNIKSAGYVGPDGYGGVKTFGASHSTGIKSKAKDKITVTRKLKEIARKKT